MLEQTEKISSGKFGHRETSLDEAAGWLEPGSLAELGEIMARAARLRQEAQGDEVEFCAIVNARSGLCSEDCAFCAQSSHYQTKALVHPLLEVAEIVKRAKAAARAGAMRFGIVTSGRDCPKGALLDRLCRAAEILRKEKIILPCASLSILAPGQAEQLKAAGFARYHHNLESGPTHFPRICTTHGYEQRVETVLMARQAGLEVCVGGIFGLGESAWERAEFIESVAELDPQSIPLNFLNPIPGTKLGSLPMLSPREALAAIAVTRIMAPKAHLRTCGGRHQVLGSLAPLMYLAGASSTMIGNYLTTKGQEPTSDAKDIALLGLKLASIGK
jgi:biotin synthase